MNFNTFNNNNPGASSSTSSATGNSSAPTNATTSPVGLGMVPPSLSTSSNNLASLAFSNNNALNTNNISWLLASQSCGTGESKEKEKARKKLAVFLDASAESVKRFKGLMSFISNTDDQEIDKLFKDNSYQIYQILLSTFSTYELGQFKAGKHHVAEKEVLKLTDLLKRVLIHLEGFVKKGWQVKSIVNILEKMLGIENIQSIRIAAFSTLLFFIEVMEKPDRYKLDLLASVIDYTPFVSDYTYRPTFAKKVFSGHEAKRFIVIQATEAPTREDSGRLVEQVFIHISSRLNNFVFWFGILKQHFLTVLYPTVCKKVGLLAASDATGFGSHCPHELQVIVINYFASWFASNTSIREYLLLNNFNNVNGGASSMSRSPSADGIVSSAAGGSTATSPQLTSGGGGGGGGGSQFTTSTPGTGKVAILLEIYRQSCRLPLKYSETIKKSIFTFHTLFLSLLYSVEMENTFGDEYYTLQTFVLNEMMSVFETDATGYEKERDALGMFIIGVYKQMIDIYPQLRPQTREILLTSLLLATTTLLRRSNTNRPSLSLEQAMLSTTLFAWIKSKEDRAAMWAQCNVHFEELYFRTEVVKQIKSKMLQVTMILKEFVYPTSERKQKRLERDRKERGGPRSPDSQEPLPDILVDQSIVQIGWDQETCYRTWINLLALLNNVHNIKDAQIHELSTSVLTDIVDIFLCAEEETDFSTSQIDGWRPVPLFDIVGARLFDCYNLDSKFTRSKVLALRSLCRMVCRHHPQYPTEILVGFYDMVNKVFVSPIVQVELANAILLHSSNIFNLAMPGANSLIFPYLKYIKTMYSSFKSQDQPPPVEVRKRSLIILGSLVFYPNHTPTLVFEGYKDETGKSITKDMTMKDLKRELIDLLIIALKNERAAENRMMCLWTLSTLVMEEFNSQDVSQEWVNEMIEVINVYTLYHDQAISKAALDSLAAINVVFPRLTRCTINLILSSLVNSILKGMQELEAGNTAAGITEQTIANHFYCLLDWVCVDDCIFDDDLFKDFRSNMFQAIESALGQRGEAWSTALERTEDVYKVLARTLTKKMTAPKTHSKGKSVDLSLEEDALETLALASPNKTLLVQEAAETLLTHCFNFVHNFPSSKQGPQITTSLIDEYDDLQCSPIEEETPLFCVLHENALISVVEIPKPAPEQGTLARLFIRDATGKYVWDFDNLYDPLGMGSANSTHNDRSPLSLIKMFIDQRQSGGADLALAPVVIDNLTYSYNNVVSLNKTKPEAKVDGILSNLLQSLSSQPDCMPEGVTHLNQPLVSLRPNLVQEFTNIQNEIESFIKQEQDYVEKAYQLSPFNDTWDLPTPSKPPQVISQSRRLLMSYLGFLDISNASYFKQLESTQKLSRALQQLDITPSRDILKIGVIYVGEGQEEQREILHNYASSSLYDDFVNGLGWQVDLSTHFGYMGGLDRKKTTGNTAPYYANTTMETIFHNISSMPTNTSEPQQIHKKRHVGNDIVNIIWSEHIRDYAPTTVTSQFNDAHIIVYPLPNGLYRIQIYRKEGKVPMFGPLIHGMAVSKQMLSTLVRQTAVNAYRYIRNSTPNYSRPYALRKMRINEIVERYRSEKNYVDFVHSIVSGYNQSAAVAAATSPSMSPSVSNHGVGGGGGQEKTVAFDHNLY
ncbi:hypothetical protein SAMD00019534_079180 [Acytostelium subglobosum LB1]|uniref:hypothetical protein n=1 Tax=Acytostelium subglobosum LB1 TaxID=1410327 RepID=UPI000644C39F|nr:hypothetical protein SAMD00019534_079180 [Acytostelium subglobosum LB1]GAM24743.1 hypothetical protein SAMD00019534_079180 [Acytostelium subglobosum LB1]|eukprot:XP_012752412.1 hypothetical protein SAMD00019534_079180 [Acytostelium subglobosum LB1]